jgi:hypothetical protein
MKEIDDGLAALLRADPTIASYCKTRIYPDNFPQDETLPAIAYTLDQDSGESLLSGGRGISSSIYLISVWSESAETSQIIADAVRTALHGYKGYFTTTRIPGIVYKQSGRSFDPSADAYAVELAIEIFYCPA